MNKVYAVKAAMYDDPYIAFATIEEACEYAVSANPGRDVEEISKLILAIPVFESFEFVDGRERGLCCSEEVLPDGS